MGCVLLSIGIVFAKNLSQEDNTPLSFYTEDLTSAIPDLIRNPVFSTSPKAGLDIPYLIRGGNDGLRNNVKKRRTHYTSHV